jgi:hypothetical protein
MAINEGAEVPVQRIRRSVLFRIPSFKNRSPPAARHGESRTPILGMPAASKRRLTFHLRRRDFVTSAVSDQIDATVARSDSFHRRSASQQSSSPIADRINTERRRFSMPIL